MTLSPQRVLRGERMKSRAVVGNTAVEEGRPLFLPKEPEPLTATSFMYVGIFDTTMPKPKERGWCARASTAF